MARRRNKIKTSNLGTSPGTLTYVGQEIDHATNIKRIEYNEADYRVDESGKLSVCRLPVTDASHITWLDVDGIHDPKVIAALGQQYHLHPLLLEDVMNTNQKPKLELYNDTVVYATLKMLHYNPQTQEIDPEHISLVLGHRYLISFQEERTADIFSPIVERIKASSGKTRRNSPDYLLYSLMDLIVDNYFSVLDCIGDKMDTLEEQIMQDRAGKLTLSTLYTLKRDLAQTRRLVWPMHDMLGVLLREESALIHKETLPYLRDLSDHVNQVIDMVDTYRDLIAGLTDVYYSTVNNRMNQVMKTLTIFSAIFMPLTFIAGIYGMNFDNMPELHTKTGYFWTLLAMFIIGVGEFIYFKRQGCM